MYKGKKKIKLETFFSHFKYENYILFYVLNIYVRNITVILFVIEYRKMF